MTKDEIEITEGTRFDRGFVSPYFITDVKTQRVEFEKPLISSSEQKIWVLQDILPSLEAIAQSRSPLVIIAEDVDGEALAACILNKLRGQLKVSAIEAPGFGDNHKSILGDWTLPSSQAALSLWTNSTSSSKRPRLISSDLLALLPSSMRAPLFSVAGVPRNAIQARCERICNGPCPSH